MSQSAHRQALSLRQARMLLASVKSAKSAERQAVYARVFGQYPQLRPSKKHERVEPGK